MILLTRVDQRLLHGQVATSWVHGLHADCICCAGDKLVNDEATKSILRLGKPADTKLVIKDINGLIEAINSGKTDKYKMIICVKTVEEAKRLADGCPQITSINLGNVNLDKRLDVARRIERQVQLLPEEETMIKELLDRGVEVEIRPLADDSKIDIKTLL